MTTMEIIALAVSIVSGLVGLTTLFTFIATCKQKQRDEGARTARADASLDTIKLQNETLLQSTRVITDKLDGQNVRLSRIEQTVADANLAELPRQIAALESSVKSAHHRIDGLERNINLKRRWQKWIGRRLL